MPCEIIDTNWKAICNKGNGNYIARSIIDIESRKDGGYNLIIRSTPDGVSWNKGSEEKGGVKYKILELIKNGKLPQIIDIDEESEKKRAEIKQNLEYAVSIVNNKVELKRNELNERKVAPVLDLNNFEAQNIFQFSRKVLSLSNNEFTKPVAEASVAPAPTAEVAPTATM